MAAAGPFANLLLVLVAALAIHLGIATGRFVVPESAGFTHVAVGESGVFQGAAILLSIVFSLNLLLAVFNLIPLPPLDGSAALGLFLPKDAARRYIGFFEGSPFSLLGIFIAWKIFDRVAGPLFGIGLNLLYPGAGYR
jgi:Zn-dependent protease